MPKISVIVPVYRVEKYLGRCVNSLLGQTLSDIEIILVDDGSPDGCPALCDEFAKKDGRIKVLHKENEGLGLARNSGMSLAVGEYIAFVDSDDYVKSEMYRTLYEAAQRENADIAMCGLCCIGGIMSAKENDVQNINCFDGYTVFDGKEGIDRLMLDISGALPKEDQDSRYGFSSVKNIYRKDVLEKNKIRFLSEKEVMSEDVFFLLDFLDKCECAVGVPGAFYCYCRNGQSLSKSYRSDRFEKCRLIIDGINGVLSKRMDESVYKIYTDRLFQAYARAACMQEIQFAPSNGIDKKELDRRLKAICNSNRLKTTLKNYPWHKLPFTQAAFAFTMRFSLVGLQKLLVKMKGKGG
mgnify:FL=1